jgi:plasmid replication initiation protein
MTDLIDDARKFDRQVRLVEKDNRLVEAKYRLTVYEQKLLIMAISKIDPTQSDFQNPYRLDVSDVSKALGIDTNYLYERVAATVDKLMTRLVKLKENDGHRVVHWVSEAKYYTGMGYFDIWFHEKMKPYLLELKQYLKYESSVVLQLQSTYSIRIYEILKKWQGANENISGTSYLTKTLVELRDILGIRKTEYPLYGDFKRRILLKAQTELSEQTDLVFEIQEKKEGRSVHSITFLIKENIPSPSKKNKSKRGRPKKAKSIQDEALETGLDIASLLDSEVYPTSLMKKFDILGIKHLKKYKDEGLTEQHWLTAMEKNSEPANIIYEAREIRKTELKNLELLKKAKEEDEILRINKAWFDLNHEYYDVDGNSLSNYIITKKGEVIQFLDQNFKEKLNIHKKDEADIQNIEEKTMEMIEREKNPFVEKMKKVRTEEKNSILTRILKEFPSFSPETMRKNKTNPEYAHAYKVGRASKYDKAKLTKIFNEILGENWNNP